MNMSLTKSKANRDGLYFQGVQRVWIATHPQTARYIGKILDKQGNKAVDGNITFVLPIEVDIKTLRFSTVDVELAGELLLIDETTSFGYADEFDYPANIRDNALNDMP